MYKAFFFSEPGLLDEIRRNITAANAAGNSMPLISLALQEEETCLEEQPSTPPTRPSSSSTMHFPAALVDELRAEKQASSGIDKGTANMIVL